MNTRAPGRSLELYFIDGNPEGMLTAEVFNWTGHVLMVPRTQIAAGLTRKEAGYTGIYLLLGDEAESPLAYIGESENIGARIRNHDQQKEWWTRAVLVTTGANNLNKAHVKYLEARLVEIARRVGRMPLENGNTPPRSSLSEAGQANMEAFLDYLLMVLPALRIDMFVENVVKPDAPAMAENTQRSPTFLLTNRKQALSARAHLVDGDFIVEAGSSARQSWEGKESTVNSYRNLYEELKVTGVLADRRDHCVFSTSYAFRSPSAAAAVVNGRTANGTVEWRLENTGETYKEWEAAQLQRQVME